MLAEDIEERLIHIEATLAGCWRRVGRRQRMLLHLFSILFLFGFFVSKPVMGMLISAHSVPADPVPCPEPCIRDSSVCV